MKTKPFDRFTVYSKHNRRKYLKIDDEDVMVAFCRTFGNVYNPQIRRVGDGSRKWYINFRVVYQNHKRRYYGWIDRLRGFLPGRSGHGMEIYGFDLFINSCAAFCRRQQLETLYHELEHIRQEVTGQFKRWDETYAYKRGRYADNTMHPAEILAGHAEAGAIDHEQYRINQTGHRSPIFNFGDKKKWQEVENRVASLPSVFGGAALATKQ